MKSKAASISLLVGLSGCGFKAVEEPPTLNMDSNQKSHASLDGAVYVDYELQNADQKKTELIKYKRNVRKGKSNTFQVEGPLTLPASVPENLRITFKANKADVFRGVDFVRTSVTSQNDSVQMTPNCKEVDDGISCVLSGLGSVIPAHQYFEGDINFAFHTKEQALGFFSIRLRTPPEKVRIEQVAIPSNSLHPVEILQNGLGYFKIREYEITNNQTDPIQISFSRKGDVKLVSEGEERIYVDFHKGHNPEWMVHSSKKEGVISMGSLLFREDEFPINLIEKGAVGIDSNVQINLGPGERTRISEYIVVGEQGTVFTKGISGFAVARGFQSKVISLPGFDKTNVSTGHVPVMLSRVEAEKNCPHYNPGRGGPGRDFYYDREDCIRHQMSKIKEWKRDSAVVDLGFRATHLRLTKGSLGLNLSFPKFISDQYEEKRVKTESLDGFLLDVK